jgi:hypothetical protein
MLLAIPGDNTFANYQEANRTFWRQTVLPLVARTCEALSSWLSPGFGENLTLRADTDSLDALSSEREALWTRLEKASFLTDDEKRAAIGYGPLPASAKSIQPGLIYKYPGQPRTDGGQFDFGKLDIEDVAGKPTPPAKPAPATNIQPKKTEEILKPSGTEVGTQRQGVGNDIRTTTPSDFEAIERELLNGAKEIPASRYEGKWYQRSDGTVFGIRESATSGRTIDIIDGRSSGLRNGYKVHRK